MQQPGRKIWCLLVLISKNKIKSTRTHTHQYKKKNISSASVIGLDETEAHVHTDGKIRCLSTSSRFLRPDPVSCPVLPSLQAAREQLRSGRKFLRAPTKQARARALHSYRTVPCRRKRQTTVPYHITNSLPQVQPGSSFYKKKQKKSISQSWHV